MLQFARRLGASRSGPRAGKRAVSSAPTPALPPVPVLVDAPAAPVSAAPAAAPTPAPVLRSSHSRHTRTNAVAGPSRVTPSGPSAGDASLKYDQLVGGPRGPAGLGSVSAALFWCSQFSLAQGTALAAHRHVEFVRGMYLETLGHRLAPPPEDDPRFKRVKFSGPSPLDKRKGKSVPCNKGKGRARPVDADEHEDASGDSE